MSLVNGACDKRAACVELVPRLKAQGYAPDDVRKRRKWIEDRCGMEFRHAGSYSFATEQLRGNIENPIGAAQVPLGVAGPLSIHGDHASGTFYIPLATTEGALVRSYERGMMTVTRAGGVQARVYSDENRISPTFAFRDVVSAYDFAQQVPALFPMLAREAESTTRHGRLLRVEVYPSGRNVILNFCYQTGDAHGMNMIAKATDRACRWLMQSSSAESYLLFSGLESEKHASGFAMVGGKGKKVTAGTFIPEKLLRAYLHTSSGSMRQLWQRTVAGNLHAHAHGYNGHFANGLAAIYIACGQDVANIVNAASGLTNFEVTPGGLYASVTLTSLTLATVGGGTGLGTARECLRMIDCYGAGKAARFAEVVAGTLLAGELSMGAALCSGEFVGAHEEYGRNHPYPAEVNT